MQEISRKTISATLKIKEDIIEKVAALFGEGNTLPFIARYRKEHTGGLDELQLQHIKDQLDYFKELADRKTTVLETIEKQGKLTEELKAKIDSCIEKYELEDLYLPYKPKRRTKAQVARELGLEPLALRILAQEETEGREMTIVEELTKDSVVDDPNEALKGALDIIAENICENSEIRKSIRDLTWREGIIKSRAVGDENESSGKFRDYDQKSEPVKEMPSHRILAIFRGKKEKELSFRISVDEHEVYSILDEDVITNPDSIWKRYMLEAIRDSYERLLAPQMETEIRQELKKKADEVATEVFSENLRVLLLSPPLLGKSVMALDPGLRTGVKVAIADNTGKFLSNETVFPIPPKNDVDGTFKTFDKLIEAHKIEAIAIGNGTGGKETFRVVRNYLKERGKADDIIAVMVNEAGASIYSASEIARKEFPDLDLTVRGAISIGRRLQDPLAELVKIDPKSIGVGQYQHDVDQKLLAKKLDEIVVSCVNKVGVNLNTASAPLLSRVSGMTAKTATNIVNYRNENGAFTNRQSLNSVPGIGAKTFQQSAGFLRVVGDEPLDNSAVHPERYELVRKMAEDINIEIQTLLGNSDLVKKIEKDNYTSDEVGSFTLNDIIEELAKPNRDPRDEFTPPDFNDDINDIKDLEEGMELSGIVTNVAKFGVFVDIGVHQDGMIHVSEIDYRFISDPAEVLKVGDKIKVKVIEIDKERKELACPENSFYLHLQENPNRKKRISQEEEMIAAQTKESNLLKATEKAILKEVEKKEDKQKKDVIGSGRMADLLKAALNKSEDK